MTSVRFTWGNNHRITLRKLFEKDTGVPINDGQVSYTVFDSLGNKLDFGALAYIDGSNGDYELVTSGFNSETGSVDYQCTLVVQAQASINDSTVRLQKVYSAVAAYDIPVPPAVLNPATFVA